METNIRKALVNIFSLWLVTTVIIPQSFLNGNVEIYYDYEEVYDYELKVYDYTDNTVKINVWKPCKTKCPNETISQGYSEPDPYDQLEEEESSIEVPMAIDYRLLNALKRKWNNHYSSKGELSFP